MRKGCVFFMKMLVRLAVLGTFIGVASKYKMPMIDRRTRKRMKRQARMFQHAVQGLYGNMVGVLR